MTRTTAKDETKSTNDSNFIFKKTLCFQNKVIERKLRRTTK